MDGLIGIVGVVGILLAVGAAVGLLDRRSFSLSWLLVAACLVAANDLLLTNVYGLIPNGFAGSDWNWQGKILALCATLAIASLRQFGWRETGLTLAQKEGSLRACIPVAALYCLFFVAIALAFPNEPGSGETLAFQLTMPSLEEEAFYRGTLLFALYQAFAGRWRWAGVEWSWGAVLSCLLFGLAHSFGYSDGAFTFDPMIMALTAVPSFLAVWMRLRTGSILLPVVMHSAGNAIPLLL